MKRTLIVAAGLMATALPAQAQTGTYRALGTEPFWSVNIEGGRMTYSDPENRRISVRTPRAVSTVDGRVYRSRRLTMRIATLEPCSDGMSDRLFADTVRVTVDGRELQGCGGRILPPRTLANSNWDIVSIGGQRVPGGSRYRVQFSDNRITGAAGCNRFSGGYSVSRDGLQASSLAMTRMACPGPAMRHERAFADIMRGPVRLTYPDGATLVMRGAGGEIRLRRAAP